MARRFGRAFISKKEMAAMADYRIDCVNKPDVAPKFYPAVSSL